MEPGLGVIAGCAATLRPLFKTWGFGPTSAAKKDSNKTPPKTASSRKASRTRQSQRPGDRRGSLAEWACQSALSHGDTASDEIELTTGSYTSWIRADGAVEKPPAPPHLQAPRSAGVFSERSAAV